MAFKEILMKGLVHEYAVYEPSFLDITEFVWANRNVNSTPYPLELFQDNVQSLISACVDSDSINSKKLGLKLIAALYKEIGECVISNGIGINSYVTKRKKLNFFSIDDFFELVRKLDCYTLQDTIIIPELLYNMNIVDMALYYDVPPDTIPWRTGENVADIQAYLGSYIAQQRQEGNKPSVNYWTREFTMWSRADRQDGIDKTLKPFFVSEAGKCGALYSCSLISTGCFDIFEIGLFKAGLYTPIILGEAGKRALVSVYAFFYYMYVRESENYVGK